MTKYTHEERAHIKSIVATLSTYLFILDNIEYQGN